MLSISLPMRGGGSGDYYVKLAQAGYYTNSLEKPGIWFGNGAEEAKLQGQVSPAELKNLLSGFSPDGKEEWVQIQNKKTHERQSGWDMTFSAPKSISVLWSQVSSDVRGIIEKAHEVAVKSALSFLEQEAAITRRGAGGHTWEKAKVVFALFEHGTSRENDPQLHTHAVLINLALREDGTSGSLRSRGFFQNRLAAGAVYQLELENQLRNELKLITEPDQWSFRVREVPQGLCEEFSKRSKEIREVLKSLGDFSAKTARAVTEATRPRKNQIPKDILLETWQKIGRSFGWGPEQAKELIDTAAKRQPDTRVPVRLRIPEQEDGARRSENQANRVERVAQRAEKSEGQPQKGTQSEVQTDSKPKHTVTEANQSQPEQTKSERTQADAIPSTKANSKQTEKLRADQRRSNDDAVKPEDIAVNNKKHNQADRTEKTKSSKWKRKKAKTKGRKERDRQIVTKLYEQARDRKASSNEFIRATKEARKEPYFRIKWRYLAPRAPDVKFNPIARLRIPVLVAGKEKVPELWGKVRWKANIPIFGELQFRDKYVFPNAWQMNPLKNLTIPRLVLRQHTEWKWRENLWKKNTAIGQIQFRWKRVLPNSRAGSLAHRLAMPAFRLQTKRPDNKNEQKNEQKHSR